MPNSTDNKIARANITIDGYVKNIQKDNGTCDLGRFTIIKHSAQDEKSIAEIAQAYGVKNLVDLIIFTPERIALHETTAGIVTNFNIETDAHLLPVVTSIYNDLILPRIEKFKSDKLPQIVKDIEMEVADVMLRNRQGIINLKNPLDIEYLEIGREIFKRLSKDQFILDEHSDYNTPEHVLQKILENLWYKRKVNEEVSKIVEASLFKLEGQAITIVVPNYNDNTSEQSTYKLNALPIHEGQNRHTFMLAGAPACGKGIAEKLLKAQAEKLGIAWSDVIKINTDSYRPIVSDESLGPEKWKHSDFNNDEASIINNLIKRNYKKKLDAGKAPHLLIDGVNPTQERLDLGLENGGQLHIKMVTVDPVISIERSEERGKVTGRFVNIEYLINAHKSMPNYFAQLLINNAGKPIDLELFDTDVPLGSPLILIAQGDISQRELIIHNDGAFNKFIARASAKLDALEELNNVSLYHHHQFEFMRNISQGGIKLLSVCDEFKYPTNTIIFNQCVASFNESVCLTDYSFNSDMNLIHNEERNALDPTNDNENNEDLSSLTQCLNLEESLREISNFILSLYEML